MRKFWLQNNKNISLVLGICFTQDIDFILKHMNNARYLRELDFARFHFYYRSGIYLAILKKGGGGVQSACSIRYRRALPIFTPFKITTKVWSAFILYCFFFTIKFTIVHNNQNKLKIYLIFSTDYLLGRQTYISRASIY